eukprot:scaffold1643_cov390-Prasinococcus_capsulatus_cf.AAC.2
MGERADWVRRVVLFDSRIPDVERYKREQIQLYYATAAVVGIACVLLHSCAYSLGLKWQRNDSESEKKANVSTSAAAAQQHGIFVQACLAVIFFWNWVILCTMGDYRVVPISIQSGLCSGYEVYGGLMELSRLLFARSDRYDMLLHHLVRVKLVRLPASVARPYRTPSNG